jgi:hypothetical protein
MLKKFLMIWLDGDEKKVDDIIACDAWVEMPADRLKEVLDKFCLTLRAVDPPSALVGGGNSENSAGNLIR